MFCEPKPATPSRTKRLWSSNPQVSNWNHESASEIITDHLDLTVLNKVQIPSKWDDKFDSLFIPSSMHLELSWSLVFRGTAVTLHWPNALHGEGDKTNVLVLPSDRAIDPPWIGPATVPLARKCLVKPHSTNILQKQVHRNNEKPMPWATWFAAKIANSFGLHVALLVVPQQIDMEFSPLVHLQTNHDAVLYLLYPFIPNYLCIGYLECTAHTSNSCNSVYQDYYFSSTWKIIPGSKWSITIVSKSPRPGVIPLINGLNGT